jgi:hypothetical protein
MKILSRHFPGGTEITKSSVRIADVPVEIRTEHLKNTSLDHYPYSNPYLISIIIIIIIIIMCDRLCGLVVRVSGYRSRGPGFDSLLYQIF